MRKKFTSGLIALGLFGFNLLGADDAFVGTWKLNVTKSKFPKGREAKKATLVVGLEGQTSTVSWNLTTPDDQVMAFKYTVPRAGGPVHYIEANPPPPAGLSDTLTDIDDRTVEYTSTLNGKQIMKQHIVASPDHKMMTIQESGVDEKGQSYKGVYVYDRQ